MMRERMFATLGIWAALAISVDRLLASLRYTVWTDGVPQQITLPDGTMQMIMANQVASTEFVSGLMQIAVYFIMFVFVMAAMGATIAIWDKANGEKPTVNAASAQQRESPKMKRDREMRVRRLLSVMDEEELAALEEQHLNEDEMTVAELIQQKRSTREMRQ